MKCGDYSKIPKSFESFLGIFRMGIIENL